MKCPGPFYDIRPPFKPAELVDALFRGVKKEVTCLKDIVPTSVAEPDKYSEITPVVGDGTMTDYSVEHWMLERSFEKSDDRGMTIDQN